MKDFIDIHEVSKEEIEEIHELAGEMKESPGDHSGVLEDKTLLMIFEKPSTRTRLSFEAGMTQLGGHAIYFHTEGSQISRGESLKDTGEVISRYVDGVMARMFEHEDLLHIAEHSSVPVINGLTDLLHPCQALSDLFTLGERAEIQGLHIVFVGDGNNVSHSLMQVCAKLGVDFTISSPQGFEPEKEVIERSREVAEGSGSTIKVIHDPLQAVEDADVLYTDVWVSMGQEEERKKREERFQHYQVDEDLVEKAGNPLVMHPLPAHRGKEITSGVLDSENSIVYDQAENRLHVQKALMKMLME